MLKDGDIIFNGTDEELRNSKDPYIHRFFQDVNTKHVSAS